jgi:hypothetical protein
MCQIKGVALYLISQRYEEKQGGEHPRLWNKCIKFCRLEAASSRSGGVAGLQMQVKPSVTDVQCRLLGSSTRKCRLASIFTLDSGKLWQIPKAPPFLGEVLTSATDDKFHRPRITKRVDFAPDLWMIRINASGEFKFASEQYATLGCDRRSGPSDSDSQLILAPSLESSRRRNGRTASV